MANDNSACILFGEKIEDEDARPVHPRREITENARQHTMDQAKPEIPGDHQPGDYQPGSTFHPEDRDDCKMK